MILTELIPSVIIKDKEALLNLIDNILHLRTHIFKNQTVVTISNFKTKIGIEILAKL